MGNSSGVEPPSPAGLPRSLCVSVQTGAVFTLLAARTLYSNNDFGDDVVMVVVVMMMVVTEYGLIHLVVSLYVHRYGYGRDSGDSTTSVVLKVLTH